MYRRQFVELAAGALASPAGFELEEVTITALAEGMQAGRWTARSVTATYLKRIAAVDKLLNSVIEVNPDALGIAAALDRERKQKGPRGPLHGVPVLIKDNIDTGDRMMTTAGSLALAGAPAPRDAAVAAQLRSAGAVILGKTNLSEWANFRSSRSSSGWSARGGQTHNPYALDRNPSGSSSGSGAAVAANLCVAAVGTETDGSIVSPSTACGIVGIKPTLGLIGGAGIVPIAHSQDTAGPMARTVRDAAILLGSMAEKKRDFTAFLDAGGLRGARLGIARKFAGFHPEVDRILDSAIAAMKQAGAEIVDPADLPSHDKFGGAEMEVLLYEFKADLAAYLKGRGETARVKSLADIIAFNEAHRRQEMPWFGQETMLRAEKKGPLTDEAYRQALAKCRQAAATDGIDAACGKFGVHALVAPSGGPAGLTDWINGDHDLGGCATPAAVAGYPHITVPAGFVHGLPVGLSFFGPAWSEPALLKLAYAFEQATKARRRPRFLKTVQFERA